MVHAHAVPWHRFQIESFRTSASTDSMYFCTRKIKWTCTKNCQHFSPPRPTRIGTTNYEGRSQSLWTHLITPSRNFVEVQWWSLFRSTSFGMQCTSYNAPPTSRKHAADRWSLRNFLPRGFLFIEEKPRNHMEWDLNWILSSTWKKGIGGTP
jgi:hypothetical protein